MTPTPTGRLLKAVRGCPLEGTVLAAARGRGSDEDRGNAVTVLARAEHSELKAILLDVLEEPDQNGVVLRQAIIAAEKRRYLELIDPIVGMLKRQPDHLVHQVGVHVLSRLVPRERLLAVFMELLDGPEASYAVTVALSQLDAGAVSVAPGRLSRVSRDDEGRDLGGRSSVERLFEALDLAELDRPQLVAAIDVSLRLRLHSNRLEDIVEREPELALERLIELVGNLEFEWWEAIELARHFDPDRLLAAGAPEEIIERTAQRREAEEVRAQRCEEEGELEFPDPLDRDPSPDRAHSSLAELLSRRDTDPELQHCCEELSAEVEELGEPGLSELRARLEAWWPEKPFPETVTRKGENEWSQPWPAAAWLRYAPKARPPLDAKRWGELATCGVLWDAQTQWLKSTYTVAGAYVGLAMLIGEKQPEPWEQFLSCCKDPVPNPVLLACVEQLDAKIPEEGAQRYHLRSLARRLLENGRRDLAERVGSHSEDFAALLEPLLAGGGDIPTQLKLTSELKERLRESGTPSEEDLHWLGGVASEQLLGGLFAILDENWKLDERPVAMVRSGYGLHDLFNPLQEAIARIGGRQAVAGYDGLLARGGDYRWLRASRDRVAAAELLADAQRYGPGAALASASQSSIMRRALIGDEAARRQPKKRAAEVSDDALARAPLAAAFGRRVLQLDCSEGLVVGVLGPWGSGKTTFVNYARDAARSGLYRARRLQPLDVQRPRGAGGVLLRRAPRPSCASAGRRLPGSRRAPRGLRRVVLGSRLVADGRSLDRARARDEQGPRQVPVAPPRGKRRAARRPRSRASRAEGADRRRPRRHRPALDRGDPRDIQAGAAHRQLPQHPLCGRLRPPAGRGSPGRERRHGARLLGEDPPGRGRPPRHIGGDADLAGEHGDRRGDREQRRSRARPGGLDRSDDRSDRACSSPTCATFAGTRQRSSSPSRTSERRSRSPTYWRSRRCGPLCPISTPSFPPASRLSAHPVKSARPREDREAQKAQIEKLIKVAGEDREAVARAMIRLLFPFRTPPHRKQPLRPRLAAEVLARAPPRPQLGDRRSTSSASPAPTSPATRRRRGPGRGMATSGRSRTTCGRSPTSAARTRSAPLEAYEDEFAPEMVIPASTALLNVGVELPDRPREFLGLDAEPGRRASGGAAPASPQGQERDRRRRAPDLRRLRTLTAKYELLRIAGVAEDSERDLLSEDAKEALGERFSEDVAATPAARLVGERELARVIYRARLYADSEAPPIEIPADPEVTMTMLQSARSENQSADRR